MKIIILLILVPGLVFATDNKPKKVPTTQVQYQDQLQLQKQDQTQLQKQDQQLLSEIENDIAIGNDSTAAVSINQKASAPDILIVPQGHTSNCQRTYGLSFTSQGGGGGIGWPYRDAACDYDNEAADAFASGQHKIGWFWNCQKKNSWKIYKTHGLNKIQAREKCLDHMMEMYVVEEPPTLYREEESTDYPVTVNCEVGQHPETHERIFKACQQEK